MGRIWVTSDCHFWHYNIWAKFNYDTRPFNSSIEMNEIIIRNWNSYVRPDDIVFVLGDFFMGQTEAISKILPRLMGQQIIVILGNHDSNKRIEEYKKDSRIVVCNHMILYYNHKFYVMNHYPLEGDYRGQHLKEGTGWQEAVEFFNDNFDNSVYLYGHTHESNFQKSNNVFHVGMDGNNCYPHLLDDIDKLVQ